MGAGEGHVSAPHQPEGQTPVWGSKDKGRPCLKKFQRHTPSRTLTRPPRHVVTVVKFLSPPGQWDLSQIRKGICPVPLPPYRRKLYVPRPISKRSFHLGPFPCFLAIKTDQQHMFWQRPFPLINSFFFTFCLVSGNSFPTCVQTTILSIWTSGVIFSRASVCRWSNCKHPHWVSLHITSAISFKTCSPLHPSSVFPLFTKTQAVYFSTRNVNHACSAINGH